MVENPKHLLIVLTFCVMASSEMVTLIVDNFIASTSSYA